MKILLDHCVHVRARKFFPAHQVSVAADLGWQGLKNGNLLKAAAGAFDVFLTIDKKMRFEHNLKRLPIPTVILDVQSGALSSLALFQPFVEHLLQTPLDKIIYFIQRDGSIVRYE